VHDTVIADGVWKYRVWVVLVGAEPFLFAIVLIVSNLARREEVI
jgi:hypothetical protein